MKNIFISSTFRDMQAERDLVQERVLPELRDKAKNYGENVGVIDLRWGVDTSELETDEGSRKVLSVCLDEIERSHPYMLIFMGERYGWIPDLKMIQSAVEGKADKLILDDYEKSITALEIEFGALSETYGELDKCVVCMRSPLAHLITDDIERKIYLEENPKAAEKLRKLQERMREKLGDRIIEYTADWNEAEKVFENFRTIDGQALEEAISNAYLVMFEKDWEAYANLTWQQREQLEVQAVMESKLKSFRGREKLLTQYRRQLEENNVLVLQGEVGSGKTSIMCKLMQMLEAEGKNVFRFISGNTVNSSRVFDLLKQMVWFMEEMLGIEEHFTDTATEKVQNLWDMEKEMKKQSKYDEWKDYFNSLCFRLPRESEVYFCIDALDQLSKDEHLEKMDFLPRDKKIHLVASCTTEFEIPLAFVVNGRCVEKVPLLSVEDSMEVIEGLSMASSRNVYARIRTAMLEKKDAINPLYLSFLMQRLNMMDQEELREAVGEEEIVATGVHVLQEVPESLEKAAVYVLAEAMERLSSEGETLREIFNLLATSRNGLRKEDLENLLSAQGKVIPTVDMTRMMKYLEGFFVRYSDGRIDFGHKVIRKGLREKICDVKKWQGKILEHLKTLADTDELRNREGMYFSRILEDVEFGKLLLCEYKRATNKNIDLQKAIVEEATVGFGKFYTQIIEQLATKTKRDERYLSIDFFLHDFESLLNALNNDIRIKENCYKGLCRCCDMIFQKSQRLVDLEDLASSYEKLGNVYRMQGRLERAEECYKKFLEYSKQVNETMRGMFVTDIQKMAISYWRMGQICKERRRYREAEMYYMKGLEYCKRISGQIGTTEIGMLETLSAILDDMGRLYKYQKRYAEAEKCYLQSLQNSQQIYELTRHTDRLRDLAVSYCLLGDLYHVQNNFNGAEEYYNRSINYFGQVYEILGTTSCWLELGINYLLMGDLYKEKEQYVESEKYYEKAFDILGTIYMMQGRIRGVNIREIYNKIKTVCKLQNKTSESYDTKYLKYTAKKDNFFDNFFD